MSELKDTGTVENIVFDRSVMFPDRKTWKIYKKHVSPGSIFPVVTNAEESMIAFLDSAGKNRSFIKDYDKLGVYEKERTIAIDEVVAGGYGDDVVSQWELLRDEIDDAVLEPLRNIGQLVKGVDFYRQDMEMMYGAPIADDEEKQDMDDEISFVSSLVHRQCLEVKNNILWITSQLSKK